jgi:hypothetical protein
MCNRAKRRQAAAIGRIMVAQQVAMIGKGGNNNLNGQPHYVPTRSQAAARAALACATEPDKDKQQQHVAL